MTRGRRVARLLAAASLLVTSFGGLVHGAGSARAEEAYPRPSTGVWTLDGHGFGHGRGMSQWGAYGAAIRGLSWTQILDFSYPGTVRTPLSTATAVRVRLTADSASLRVSAAPGLSVVTSGGIRLLLPTDRDQWRLVPAPGGLQLQGRLAGVWATIPVGAAAVWPSMRFEDTAAVVRVWLPDSSSVAYRGSVAGLASGPTVVTVLTLPLESYLRGVVPRESPASWPAPALMAQAVAARTYAWSAIRRNAGGLYDICDTTACQVFGGTTRYSAAGTAAPQEYAGSDAAVSGTAGTVLTFGGSPALTEYSASNGGWSTSGSEPYLRAQPDPYDGAAPGDPVHSWTASLPASVLEARFPSIGTVTRLVVTGRDGNGDWGGRVTTVRVEGTRGSVSSTGATIASFRPYPTYADGLRSSWWTFDDRPPFGSVDGRAVPSGAAALVSGWAIDPDTSAPVTTRLVVDGVVAATVIADRSRPDVGAAYPGYGDLHGFSVPVPVSVASRVACVQLVNVGSSGTYVQPLACRALTALGPTAPAVVSGGSAAVSSSSGTTWMSVQSDGNVVVYDAQLRPLWSSSTFVRGARLVTQADGNLVLYDLGNRPVWATMTTGSGNRLVMQTDGNLVLYAVSGRALWDSKGFTRTVPRRF